MKRALVLSLICLLAFSALAVAGPYFEFNQDVLPAPGAAIPIGGWQAGVVFSFSQVNEFPCPKEDPCGGIYQYEEISFCGDLYVGDRNMWFFPASIYVGIDLDLSWGYVNFNLGTELGFEPNFAGWPWMSPGFDYWTTNVELLLKVAPWARLWFGVNLDYDPAGAGSLAAIPYIGFRIGDQGGCP